MSRFINYRKELWVSVISNKILSLNKRERCWDTRERCQLRQGWEKAALVGILSGESTQPSSREGYVGTSKPKGKVMMGGRQARITAFIFLLFCFWIFTYSFGCTRFVVVCELLIAARRIEFPDQGSNPGFLLWEYGVLATGPAEKSQESLPLSR